MSRITKKQFEQYKECVLHWIEVYGLKEYKILFDHCSLRDAHSTVTADVEACIATFRLNTQGTKQDPTDIEVCAKHEVYHLLFAKLSCSL